VPGFPTVFCVPTCTTTCMTFPRTRWPPAVPHCFFPTLSTAFLAPFESFTQIFPPFPGHRAPFRPGAVVRADVALCGPAISPFLDLRCTAVPALAVGTVRAHLEHRCSFFSPFLRLHNNLQTQCVFLFLLAILEMFIETPPYLLDRTCKRRRPPSLLVSPLQPCPLAKVGPVPLLFCDEAPFGLLFW